jgi:hypothetical protein
VLEAVETWKKRQKSNKENYSDDDSKWYASRILIRISVSDKNKLFLLENVTEWKKERVRDRRMEAAVGSKQSMLITTTRWRSGEVMRRRRRKRRKRGNKLSLSLGWHQRAGKGKRRPWNYPMWEKWATIWICILLLGPCVQ